MSLQHAGRKVVITGGARGIGLGIAKHYVAEGASVAVIGRDREAGDAATTALSAQGAQVSFIQGDLQELEEIPRMIAQAREFLGGIDTLCHAAGIYPEVALAEMTVGDWDAVMRTNLTAAMVLVRECLNDLTTANGGRVVMISSITGPRTGIANLSHYAASKGGLDGFVRAAAVELAPSGITVNAVAPGTILTESLQELYADPEVMRDVSSRIPVGRIGVPDDIAAAVGFLSTPGAAFITGQSIIVDGGQTLPEVQ